MPEPPNLNPLSLNEGRGGAAGESSSSVTRNPSLPRRPAPRPPSSASLSSDGASEHGDNNPASATANGSSAANPSTNPAAALVANTTRNNNAASDNPNTNEQNNGEGSSSNNRNNNNNNDNNNAPMTAHDLEQIPSVQPPPYVANRPNYTYPSGYVYKYFKLSADSNPDSHTILSFAAVKDMFNDESSENPPHKKITQLLFKLPEHAVTALNNCIREMDAAEAREHDDEAKQYFWVVRSLDIHEEDNCFIVGLSRYFYSRE